MGKDKQNIVEGGYRGGHVCYWTLRTTRMTLKTGVNPEG